MFSFIAFIILIVLALSITAFAWWVIKPTERAVFYVTSGAVGCVSLVFLVMSMVITVPSSKQGVVTVFGKVQEVALNEGVHFVQPWAKSNDVYLGMDVAAASKAQAASKDMQSVRSDLTVNFQVDPASAVSIFRKIPSLQYKEAFVVPAMHEVFKSVVAGYTAEELVTQRQVVSAKITESLNARLSQYHLKTQSVNLVNFGFSKAFDEAIEAKVTASQRAETAQRDLERVKFEAEARVAQAKGEAAAITIQAAATEKAGGDAYIRLQAIQKWDGKLPQYVTGGSPMPFVNVK